MFVSFSYGYGYPGYWAPQTPLSALSDVIHYNGYCNSGYCGSTWPGYSSYSYSWGPAGSYYSYSNYSGYWGYGSYWA